MSDNRIVTSITAVVLNSQTFTKKKLLIQPLLIVLNCMPCFCLLLLVERISCARNITLDGLLKSVNNKVNVAYFFRLCP